MANPFNKLRLKSAAPNSTYFNLSCNHLTTCDFSQLRPSYYRELYLGDKFKVKMDVTAFTAPLVVPPMGVAHLKSRAFFVPYRIVWKYFNDFYNRKKVNRGNTLYTPFCPMFGNETFVSAFINFNYAPSGYDRIKLVEVVSNEATSCDIRFHHDDSTTPLTEYTRYNFTPYGRQVIAFLRSLGYTFTWDIHTVTGVDYSALPIMCALRAFLDYYVPASFIQQHPINGFLNEYYDTVGDGVVNSVDCDHLLQCLVRMFVSYPDNYFTSAWSKPNMPYGSTSSQLNTTNSVGGTGFQTQAANISSNENNTYFNISSNNLVTQYGIDLLRAFDSWVKRNNFAGAARVSDALFARFGIRPADARLDRTEFLGYDDTLIKWQMITNVSSSDGAELGSFGAKGYAEGSGKEFTYEAKEVGLFLILSSLQADAIYYHGTDKQNMQTSAFEFFQPEFEKIGMQPVKVAEIFNDATFSLQQPSRVSGPDVMAQLGLLPNEVYGYVPQYSSFKIPHDIISGDFTIPTLGQELSSWHFGREFNFQSLDHSEPYNNFKMSPLNVRYQPLIHSQFNRIFNVTDDSADHFIMVYSFNVDAWRPMLSISDSLPIDGYGEQVEVQPDGTHLD